MAKRSREDFELATAESNSTEKSDDEELPNELSTPKIVHLTREKSSNEALPRMLCSLPPHREPVAFGSLDEYEVHYKKEHSNRCVECRKNFPSEHLLSLHIEENHDALVSVMRDRGERTYACFVEDCERKCSTPQKRRMHMIDKHLFPKDYDFSIVNDGLDSRSSMLRSGRFRRRSSVAQELRTGKERRRSSLMQASPEMDAESSTTQSAGSMLDSKPSSPSITNPGAEMQHLTNAMSSLKFVPPSIRFGRKPGAGRGGLSKT